jgi:hypothetical protein
LQPPPVSAIYRAGKGGWLLLGFPFKARPSVMIGCRRVARRHFLVVVYSYRFLTYCRITGHCERSSRLNFKRFSLARALHKFNLPLFSFKDPRFRFVAVKKPGYSSYLHWDEYSWLFLS